jgi:hypothetical protein
MARERHPEERQTDGHDAEERLHRGHGHISPAIVQPLSLHGTTQWE